MNGNNNVKYLDLKISKQVYGRYKKRNGITILFMLADKPPRTMLFSTLRISPENKSCLRGCFLSQFISC